MKTDAQGGCGGQIPSDFLPVDPGAQWAPAPLTPPPQRLSWAWGAAEDPRKARQQEGPERRAGNLGGAGH